MKPISLFVGFLGISLLAGCNNSDRTTHAKEKNWSEIFLTDLAAARSIIRDNHPGAIDPENPSFNIWLEEGYEKARALAPKIKSGRDYRYALASYDAGFRDGHLVIAPDMKNGMRVGFEREVPVQRWPGFLTEMHDDRYKISHTSYALRYLKDGTVLSCDGKPAKQITKEQIFDFGRDPALPAHWVNAVKYTFTDHGNTLAPVPSVCEIELPDKSTKTQELAWRDYDFEELGDVFNQLGFSRSDRAGNQWINDHLLWVTIPHFQPSGDTVDVYKSMQKEITDKRDDLKSVVFDLRGNGGGSSFWGDGFVKSVWGDDITKSLKNAGPSGYVEWRVTPNNIEKMTKWLAGEVKDNGENTEGAKWALGVITGMQDALSRGDAMWREAEAGETVPLNGQLLEKLEQGPDVYVLTDGYCASACLDFMDILKASPSTVHIGYETSADTQYMDITSKKLPSGLMSVIYPVKVYRGRERPDGGYFTPDFRYEGSWNTKDIKDWTAKLISEQN